MLQRIAALTLIFGTMSAYATAVNAAPAQDVEWKLSVTEDFNGCVLDGNLWGRIGKGRSETLVLLPGKSHGLRSLMGCSPWGH